LILRKHDPPIGQQVVTQSQHEPQIAEIGLHLPSAAMRFQRRCPQLDHALILATDVSRETSPKPTQYREWARLLTHHLPSELGTLPSPSLGHRS
jgi:hypothetical protein